MRMPQRRMHVAKIVRHHNGRTYVSYLLRRSYRVGAQVKHETLANLSHLPEPIIDLIRRSLQGETFVPAAQAFRITRSRPHGHVQAVLGTIRKLGLDTLLGARPSRPRQLALAMLAERLLFPSSKLANMRHWHTTTLAEELAITDATETEVYHAMDWLLARQPAIEQHLAQHHLATGSLVLYDVSSSYYHGRTCPLARHGHNRDGKKGLPIIVYGVITTADGCPMAVDVYPGNTADPTTVPDQVIKLRERFGLERVVLVGDRGMLTDTQIDKLRVYPGLSWISALRSRAIQNLLDQGRLQRSLFDATNLAEIKSPDFPGERLVACYNPLLAEERHRKRQDLLRATEELLRRLAAEVARRTQTPLTQTQIALKAGRRVNRFKMAKHFQLTIRDGVFTWSRRVESVTREEQLDGIYVIRTSEPRRRLPAEEAVRSYKRLAQVEQAFRALKGLDVLVRPIYHRVEPRVRAHIFLCLLAYHVEWHMRQAWAPLLFADEELATARAERDPVAPAEPSEAATAKKRTKHNSAGVGVHSWRTLLAELATRTRNTCVVATEPTAGSFEQCSEPTPLQAEALRLLGL
jgi:transposase